MPFLSRVPRKAHARLGDVLILHFLFFGFIAIVCSAL